MTTSRTELLKVIQEFSGQQRILTTPKVFVELTKDHTTALLLNQILYWAEKTKNPEGWFYKSAEEWNEELGMSRYQVTRSIKILEKFGVETKLKKANGSPTLHYRINQNSFLNSFLQFIEKRTVFEMDIKETAKTDIEVSLKTDIKETAKSITEDYVTEDYKTEDDDDTPEKISSSSSTFEEFLPDLEKTITKEISITKIPKKLANAGYSKDEQEAIKLYKQESGDRGVINSQIVAELVREYSLDWFIKAYKLMRSSGKQATNLGYVKGTLKICKEEGHPPGEGAGKATETRSAEEIRIQKGQDEMMRNYLRKQEEENYE